MEVVEVSNYDWLDKVLPTVLSAELIVVKRKAKEEGAVYTNEVKPVVRAENPGLEYRTGMFLDVRV